LAVGAHCRWAARPAEETRALWPQRAPWIALPDDMWSRDPRLCTCAGSSTITAHRSRAAQSGARSGLTRAVRALNLPTLVTTCGHRVMGTESRASGAPLARSSPGRWPDADSDSGTPN